ncbi:MAG: hypothetical protein BGO67_06710 [Alphaproteobacteria bacterium 41-28]|nr:MAG: hypothetical protein BGO67_06710 [Alphaproteobacteria bacterium 41-28]
MKKKLITVMGTIFFSGMMTIPSYSAGCEEELTACQRAFDRFEKKEDDRTCHNCHIVCLKAVTKCHYRGNEAVKKEATRLLEICHKRCY